MNGVESRMEEFQRIIKNASTVAKQADALIHRVGSGDLSARLVRGLQATPLMATMLGDGGGLDESPKNRLRVFWHAVRATVYAQFSGFALDSENSREEILNQILTVNGAKVGVNREYWSSQSTSSLERSCVRLSFYAAVLATIASLEGRKQTRHGPLIAALHGMTKKELREFVEMVGFHSIDGIEASLETHGLGSRAFDALLVQPFAQIAEAIEVERFLAVVQRLEARVRDVAPAGVERPHRVPDHRLIEGLKRVVPRGKERADAFTISALLHALAGRYLCPDFKPAPEWKQLIQDAIETVLVSQEPDSSWHTGTAHGGQPPRDSSARVYLPLVRILDLPNELLTPQLGRLLTAADQAVAELTKEMERLQIRIASDGGASMNEETWKELALAVYSSFMVGTVVSDRFKDLLSDAILDSLGAEDPDPGVEWDSVPDSLDFKKNIQEGVLNLWKFRSEQRPGALLFYGPPGTGKTTIARVIARELNQGMGSTPSEGGRDRKWRFVEFTPADFARSGTDHVVASAEQIFSKLRQVRRCVVLLDEMEEFLRARGSESDRDSRLVTTAFLPLLQEAVRSREIILVVATNFVGTIDPAVTRRGRFDLILPLGPPDRSSRLKILKDVDGYAELKASLADGGGLSPEEVDKLVTEYTMGYSRPEIVDFVLELDRLRHDGSQFLLAPADRAQGTGARAQLIMGLWRIRQERVPTALSGRTGSNWQAFGDEARRYRRYAVGFQYPAATVVDPARSDDEDQGQDVESEYWREPKLPRWEDRWPEEARMKGRVTKLEPSSGDESASRIA